MRVEALPGTPTVIAHVLLQIHNKKMFDSENEGECDGAHNIRNCAVRWQIEKCMKDNTQFCGSSHRFCDISISN